MSGGGGTGGIVYYTNLICFTKLENGNIAVYNVETRELIMSLSPRQNIVKDVSNPNNIIIKSSTGDEKGITFRYQDINGDASEPYINTESRDETIGHLMNNFFFEVGSGGEKVVFVETGLDLPYPGTNEVLYTIVQSGTMLIWEDGQYVALGENGLQNLENQILTHNSCVRTFYPTFSATPNERVKIVLPQFNTMFPSFQGTPDGKIKVKIHVNKTPNCVGTMESEFDFSFTSDGEGGVILSPKPIKNKGVNNIGLLTAFGIGALTLATYTTDGASLPYGYDGVQFVVEKRSSLNAGMVKIEVFYETTNFTHNEYWTERVYNEMLMTEVYTSASPAIPYNYKTEDYLPVYNKAVNEAKQMVLNPDGTVITTNQNYHLIPFRKSVFCSDSDPLNSSYVGQLFVFTDDLNIVETGGALSAKNLFSNIIITPTSMAKLLQANIFSTHGDITLHFGYLLTVVGATPTHYNTFNSIKSFNLVEGWNYLDFGDVNYFEIGQNQLIVVRVQSTVIAERKVVLNGGITILG